MDDFISKRLPQSFDGLFRLNSDVQENRVTRQSSHMNVPRFKSALSSNIKKATPPIAYERLRRRLAVTRTDVFTTERQRKMCI